MDAGLSLVLALVAFVSFGLIYFRVRDAVSDLSAYLWQPEPSTVSERAPHEVMSRSPEPRTDTSTDTSTISANAKAPYPHLTEREVVLWLAGLKTADTWRYSANKIYALVGGHRNEVMGWVRTVRGDEPVAPPDDEVVTPYAGRRTRASYYPTEPELEYQEPEVR